MSEPRDRARRVVATGAAALAIVLAALAAAAWKLVETETADAGLRGKAAIELARDDLVRALAMEAERPSRGVSIDSMSAADPPPPRTFEAAPPIQDAEAAFLIREAEKMGPSLARAALKRAEWSDDLAARLAATAAGVRLELREGTGRAAEWLVPWAACGQFLGTRDALLLEVLHPQSMGDSFSGLFDEGGRQQYLSMRVAPYMGSRDETDALSMLAALRPDGLEQLRSDLRRRAEESRIRAALRRVDEVEGRFRVAIESDGSAVAASRPSERFAWHAVRLDPSRVGEIAATVLGRRAMRLVRSEASTLPVAIAAPGDGGWAIAASFAEAETRSRSTLLLSGLGVGAAAAVVAFAAFASSVRRDARLATLRTEFVATVSHELRTPVAVVRTAAETLAAGRATKEEDRLALTAAIARESARLSDLVGNVMDFARMEAGRRTYAFRETDVGALVREVASRHEGVDVEIEDGLPRLHCDAEALAAAIGNLLDNAKKYSFSESRSAIRSYVSSSSVVIEVADHGIGVPNAEKAHIFERFFRGADARVRDTRGAGIGLALVQHAAEAHGGRAEVADTPGGGATFRIVLPAKKKGDA